MPKFTVIIVNYNSAGDVQRAVASVLAARHGDQAEIVIVDNASPDGSGAHLSSEFAAVPSIRVLCNQVNEGFAAACNRAARLANGQLILLLNPDARVRPELLVGCAEVFGADPSIGFVGPQLLDAQGRTSFSCRPSWGTAYFLQRHIVPSRFADRWGRRYCRSLVERGGTAQVGWLLGACIFIRSDVWRRLAGLDQRFFLSADDTADLCARGMALGLRSVYCPEMIADHDGASTWRQFRAFTAINLYNGHLVFAEKHCSVAERILLRLFFVAISAGKAAITSMVGLVRRGPVRDYASAHRTACRWLLFGSVGNVGMVIDRRALRTVVERGTNAEKQIPPSDSLGA
jgi:GT2 family glycosyltransferase